MKKLIIFFCLYIFLITALSAQQTNSAISTQEQIAETVKLAPCEMKDRLETVKKLFASMEAKEEEVEVEQFKKISNVKVVKKGKTDEIIVIGAHYDKVEAGCGAIDNWTGVSILAHLFRSLSQIPTQKTLIFIAFDQEEKGLLGSEAMAKAIPKENRKNYCSMVNVDSFGVAVPQVMTNTSNSKMTKFAKNLAQEMKMPFAEAAINGDADSHSFLYKGIPAITFHGLDGNWEKYLHSKEDKIERINMQSVYFGYRFVLGFIAKIDSEGCQAFR